LVQTGTDRDTIKTERRNIMVRDYIPARDARFDNGFKFLTRYVARKCGEGPWPHRPMERRRKRPPRVKDVRIYYGVFKPPPAEQKPLPVSMWAAHCPHRIRFRETGRGKQAYFALKWEIQISCGTQQKNTLRKH
jgi:hypothetical protein